jgi:chemotaxis protein MotB
MSKSAWASVVLAAAIATAGCASEDWEGKYKEQAKANLDIVAQNDALKQQRAEEAAKNEQLAQQLKQTDMETQKARQAADALAKQNDDLRQGMASAQNAPTKSGTAAPSPAPTGPDAKALQEVVDQLKHELGKQAPSVTLTKDGNIEITLAADVTFGSGSSELSESGKKSVRTLAPLLKGKFAPYQVRVEGHTDATPLAKTKDKYKDNFGLGSARALSVVRFMESDLGIEPTRLMSASRGEHEPVADNKTDAGKKHNRRVEVIVVVPHDAATSMAK